MLSRRNSLPFTRGDSSSTERKGIAPTSGSGGAAARRRAALANGRMKTSTSPWPWKCMYRTTYEFCGSVQKLQRNDQRRTLFIKGIFDPSILYQILYQLYYSKVCRREVSIKCSIPTHVKSLASSPLCRICTSLGRPPHSLFLFANALSSSCSACLQLPQPSLQMVFSCQPIIKSRYERICSILCSRHLPYRQSTTRTTFLKLCERPIELK